MFAYGSTFFYCIITICVFLLFLVLYFKYVFSYWYGRGIPTLSPVIPLGDFGPMLTGYQCMAELARDLYFQLKRSGHPHGGLYFINTPVYMPINEGYIKSILTTDFEYFHERGVYFNEKKDPVAAHLFNLPSNSWKLLRNKLSPTFTSGKIKIMFSTMVKCSKGLLTACTSDTKHPVDINDITVRFIVDVIGSCAFGVECNSLLQPNCQFRNVAEKVINPPPWYGIKTFLSLVSPKLCRLTNLRIIQKDVNKFFVNLVKENIVFREKNGVIGSDFLQLLINIKKKDMLDEKTEMPMTNQLAAAQAFVFFAAGFETSSLTATLCLFELSRNEKLQEEVRTEICDVLKKDGGELTFEGLKSMSHLNRCVLETMRKYPPLGFLNRVCTKQYRIPETDVVLEKGTSVLVSLLGLHNDPDHYPDPETFEPDRFSDKGKSHRTPFTYLPFGEGRRMCIGARFGSVQTKVCLAVLLQNFRFTLNPLTKLPLEYNFTSFVLSPKHPILLNAVRVSQ